MSLWSHIKKGLLGADPSDNQVTSSGVFHGISPDEKDTISVIQDLSRVVKNNPEALETYLALGSLFRARGDFERAVQIRESLLLRPELTVAFKARTYFELGQDYRRIGILDRALQAYNEAAQFGIAQSLINVELAALYADSGDFAKAVSYYGSLGNKIAEAHYMVRQAKELASQNPLNTKKTLHLIHKALKVFPASPEAWSALILEQIAQNNWKNASKTFQKCLEQIPSSKHFMIFEELLKFYTDEKTEAKEYYQPIAELFLPLIQERISEVAPFYFGALVFNSCGRHNEAEQWLNKALIIQPDFWFGHLAQLDIARSKYCLPPIIDTDLIFFIHQSKRLRRFICTACGLKRNMLFYCCQRCRSWHSASYIFTLSD
jgi:lipopolysaccharide biosynthesis regulator YciM